MSQLPSRSTTLIVSRSNKPAHSHENGLLRFWFLLAPTYFSVYPAGLRHTGTCPVSIRQVPTFYSDISWILAHALSEPSRQSLTRIRFITLPSKPEAAPQHDSIASEPMPAFSGLAPPPFIYITQTDIFKAKQTLGGVSLAWLPPPTGNLNEKSL